jgi:murein L,D-transpeptidase YcbB/YkuD
MMMMVSAAAVPVCAADGSTPNGSMSYEYQRTLSALEHYRVLAADDDAEILPATKKPVEQGTRYPGVPRLRRLLSLLGDLPEDTVPGKADIYDSALVQAVKRFQMRHGLEPDGRLGKGTLEQLNTPLSVRVRQLELALERRRRIPFDPSRREIVLNLPEFRLRAFDPGHEPALEMKIIIGRARRLQTPILSSEVDTVLFRPYWNVPMSIQRNELVPHIKRDPAYIAKNDFELVTSKREVVEPDEISDTILAQLRSGALHLRQRRGPKNSLGLVKFVFPSEYDVYMHDTPAKSLFAKARRDFSHGCIRLEKAADLADWILSEESGWPRERIEEAMEAADSTYVKLKNTIPVRTIYVTAVVQEDGEVNFFEDIYGRDATLEKELENELAGEAAAEQVTSGEPGPHPHE